MLGMVLRCLIRWEMGLAARKTAKKRMSCVILCSFFLYAYIVYALEARLPVLCSAGTTRLILLKIPPTDETNQKGLNEEQKEG